MQGQDARRIAALIARGEYEEALGLDPGAPPEAVSRAHLRLLHRHRTCGFAREPLNRAKGALLKESDLDRGRRLFGLGRVHEALPFLEAGAAGAGTADDRLILGQSLWRAQRFGDAAASFAAAVALRGTAEELAWLAAAQARLGAWREAESSQRRVAALRGDADDFASLGQILWAQGRRREATAMLRHSEAMNPNGIAAELLGSYRRALRRARLERARRRCGDVVRGAAGSARRLAGGVRTALTWAPFAVAVGCLAVGEPIAGAALAALCVVALLAARGG
jgi:tetratricopeptide (TPR) repeat protein